MHSAALVPIIYVAVVTPPLVLTDLRHHRLPNLYVVPGIGLGILSAAVEWSLFPLVAGAAYGLVILLLGAGGNVGMGDVKLAVLLGLASPTLPIATTSPIVAFLLGGVIASIALVRRGRDHRIPFGPAMLAGYWVAVVAAVVSGTVGISP